jgi:threonine/homoserine/homoserine lactone efflux protein
MVTVAMTELLGPLVTFAVATSVTPGPNNVMITASGANFGFARSVPHMLGVGIGFMAMIVGVGLGLGQAFERVPMLHEILRYGGALYLLSTSPGASRRRRRRRRSPGRHRRGRSPSCRRRCSSGSIRKAG